MRKKDFYSALFFLAFAVFLYAQSFAIRMSKADSLGPQFFPRLVAYAMAILAVIQVYRYFNDGAGKEADPPAKIKINLPLFATIGILVLYFLLLKQVGFIVLTTLYLFCQIFLLLPTGSIKIKRTVIIAAIVSIVAPAGIYILFYKAFTIFLPPGILG